MNRFKSFVVFTTIVVLHVLTSCGHTDPDPVTTPPDQSVDYTTLKSFFTSSISSSDYIKQLIVGSSEISFTANSGKKVSVARNDVPYLMVNATNDNWSINGKMTQLEIPSDVMDKAPKIDIDGAGNLLVNGKNTNVASGKELYCIINARKHIYLYFPDAVFALGCEMYNGYNPPLRTDDNEINILFIGNSFTQDATEHLPGMLKCVGINNVYMLRLFHGGYTLPEYLANFSNQNVCAARPCNPGDSEWESNESLDDSPATALAAKEWDIIVLQEHTGRKEGWEWPGTLESALQGLINKIITAQPNHRPTIVYLMAQTYSEGSNVLTSNFSNNRALMFATTSFVAKKVLEKTMIDKIISTGAVLENLRTTSLNIPNGMQLTRDSYHMDYGISRYAAACAVFETLITPTTGKKLSDLSYRYNNSNTATGSYTTPVTDSNAPIAQRAASEAVAKPFEVTDLSIL